MIGYAKEEVVRDRLGTSGRSTLARTFSSELVDSDGNVGAIR